MTLRLVSIDAKHTHIFTREITQKDFAVDFLSCLLVFFSFPINSVFLEVTLLVEG